MDTILRFPEGFLWGTATAAHQVEGNNIHNDWWASEQRPDWIADHQPSGLACDWWQRAEQDFDLAHSLGQNAHRLSIEWSRIEPRPGEWNHAAIDRYREMLQALRDREMEPMVTLLHFTLPNWFAHQGAWETPTSASLFARFVRKAVDAFGDLVHLWITLNEPTSYTYLGYVEGRWPPFKKQLRLVPYVIRNLLRSHGLAYRAIHEQQPNAQVSVAHYLRVFDPANPASPLDRRIAAWRDRLLNRLFFDALVDGVLRPPFGLNLRIPEAVDSLDFIGVNYYFRDRVAFDLRQPQQLFGRHLRDRIPADLPPWVGEVYADGLRHWLERLAVYGKPVYVTENGCLDRTDSQRPGYILEHLIALYRAIQAGAPVKGYFHWTLVDNFEWAEGYTTPFGLIHVDFATQTRTVKRSGELYGEIAKANAISPEMVARYAPHLLATLI